MPNFKMFLCHRACTEFISFSLCLTLSLLLFSATNANSVFAQQSGTPTEESQSVIVQVQTNSPNDSENTSIQPIPRTSLGEDDDDSTSEAGPPDPALVQPMPLEEWTLPLAEPRTDGLLSYTIFHAETGATESIDISSDSIQLENHFSNDVRASSIESSFVFGSLQRVNSNFSRQYPWSTIVDLDVTYGGNTWYHCNGAMVNPRIVITSGQCVYNHNTNIGGKQVQDIFVYPARENSIYSYGYARMIAVAAPNEWTQSKNFGRNWGFIALDHPVGAITSWLGWSSENDTFFNTTTFNNPFYFDQKHLHNRSGKFDTIEPELLILNQNSVDNNLGAVAIYNDRVYSVNSACRDSCKKSVFVRMIGTIGVFTRNFINKHTPSTIDVIPLTVRVEPSSIVAGERLTKLDILYYNDFSATWNDKINTEIYLSSNN